MKNLKFIIIFIFTLNPIIMAHALPDPERKFYSYSNPEFIEAINTINNIDIRVMPSNSTTFLIFDDIHNKEKMIELDHLQRRIEDGIFESISSVLKGNLSFNINKHPEGVQISKINFDNTLLLDITYDLEILEEKGFIFSSNKIHAVAIEANIKFKETNNNTSFFYSIVDFEPKVFMFEKRLNKENLDQYFYGTIIHEGFWYVDPKKRLK